LSLFSSRFRVSRTCNNHILLSGGNNQPFSTTMSHKKNIKVAGYSSCGAFQQAKNALVGLKAIYSHDYDVSVDERKYFSSLSFLLLILSRFFLSRRCFPR
jgi:hypothetical protein